MSDLIDRQVVIDAITDAADKFDWPDDYHQAMKEGIRIGTLICSLVPSAQPERKQGHWAGIDDEPCETWECDQCGHIQEFFDGDQPNYCSNCGADMREVDDE